MTGGCCLLHLPSTDQRGISPREWGAAPERDALSLSKGSLFWIWINLNGARTEGIYKTCLRNNRDRYSCDACIYKWECVRSRALRGLLCAPSLTLISSQSLTRELGWTFIFKLCWVPLWKVLSFGLFVANAFIRRCYYIGRGTIKTHF